MMITDAKPVIAIIAVDGVEHEDLSLLRELFEQGSLRTCILSGGQRWVVSQRDGKQVTRFRTSAAISQTSPAAFCGVLVPGGLLHAKTLAHSPDAIRFLRSAYVTQRLIAAVAEGVAPLTASGVMEGKQHAGVNVARLTGRPDQRSDLVYCDSILTCNRQACLHHLASKFLSELQVQLINARIHLLNVKPG